MFVVGWVAERHPRLIEEVRAAGHEIGSHGYIHDKAYDLGPERFLADLRASLRVLAPLSGEAVSMFTAEINRWRKELH